MSNQDLFIFSEAKTEIKNQDSYFEEFKNFLDSLNLSYKLENYIFDIDNHDISIFYFELSKFSEFKNKDINKNTFLRKLEEYLKKGKKLITLYSDEWINKKEIVKHRLLYHFNKIEKICNARDCNIEEISLKTYDKFVNKYHIQGSLFTKIRLGAFYEEELVSVMGFGKRRIALGAKKEKLHEKEYEILRFCSKGNIPGIGSKFMKYFIKTYDPEIIITYADRRWGEGHFYKNLGFEFHSSTEPSYFYTKDFMNRKYRFSFRKDIIVSKYGGDPKLTETENMILLGYDRIWDCGTNKYIWRKNNMI